MPRRTRSSTGSNTSRSPKRTRRSIESTSRHLRERALGPSEGLTGRRLEVSDDDFYSRNTALGEIGSREEEPMVVSGTPGSREATPEPSPEPAKPAAPTTELRAREADFMTKFNRQAHHTDEYEDQSLIVRRGQEIMIKVEFSRAFDKDHDRIVLQFVTGSRPMESKETVVRIQASSNAASGNDDWAAQYTSTDGNSVSFSVMSSADAIIGRYNMFVETLTRGENNTDLRHRRKFDDGIIMLFNAWRPEDDVYVEDEAEREEYVMNEKGRIWQGSMWSATHWNFGQFEDVCLDAALLLLDKAELLPGAWGNPVSVSRALSKMANSNDADSGVLSGRWTDTYPADSTKPWEWAGSVKILEEYMQTRQAVRFGQCWVFSGLLTTLCRTLGIPVRSVTNFESAHDSDASMTIDFHFDEDGEPLKEYNDSIWNFHVWNEVFMKRPDLPEGNEGWQVIDATPQELSEGVMCCGPAPVKAIKEGKVYLQYDGPFIFAEVNGDKVHWTVHKDGSMEMISVNARAVGEDISTKAVGSNKRHDLTRDYKYKDGSEEERAAVARAFRYSSRRAHRIYNTPPPDVEFSLQVPREAELGNDFQINVSMKNKSDEKRSVDLRLTAVCSYYTGVPSDQVGTSSSKFELDPGAEETSVMDVGYAVYKEFLKTESSLMVYMRGKVLETDKAYADVKSFSLKMPEMEVEAPDSVKVGESFDVIIKIQNPLEEKLTGCVINIEAPGMVKSKKIKIKKAIGGKELQEESVTLTARRSGIKEIDVNFTCDQPLHMSGSAEVKISYSE